VCEEEYGENEFNCPTDCKSIIKLNANTQNSHISFNNDTIMLGGKSGNSNTSTNTSNGNFWSWFLIILLIVCVLLFLIILIVYFS